MKKSIITILLSSLLIGCNGQKVSSMPKNIEKGNLEMKIMVATDLHLFSNNLISKNNEIYKKDSITSDGRVQEYDYELVNELVNQANELMPDYLIITGDLTFNGELDSHRELIKIISQVNKNVKVLVLPGNHDYNNISPQSIINDEVRYTEGIDMDDFPLLYENFGYTNAYSYDEESLSYIYALSENKWIVMLDSTNSRYNYDYDMNIIGGELSTNTIKWLEENLTYASNNGIEVISSMHHNLLTHNELFNDRYTLYNNQELLQLYKEHNVKINFSGHLHIQSIKESQGVYDISNGSLLDYGNRYGLLNIYDNCYEYNSYSLNPNLGFDFNSYSFNVFYKKYYNKQINSCKKYYGENAENICDINSKINAYYFDGNYQEIHKIISENKKYIRKVKRNDNEKYMNLIYEVENINQHNIMLKK